jgi:hypothetical protein
MGLAFIRHAESHNLELLQLGRQKGDDKLLAKVNQLQQALEAQAQFAIEQEKRKWEKLERPHSQIASPEQGESGTTEGPETADGPESVN